MDPKKTSCPICLGPFRNPATIPCGHSYCMSCIKGLWDEEDRRQIHSCPQCGKTFSPRPALMKNTMLAVLMEKQKNTGPQPAAVAAAAAAAAAPPGDLGYAGPEDVACDVCTGRKLRAIKSCLMCKASYCEKHLQPHYESPASVKHKLLDPSKQLQENLCKVKRVFCRAHQNPICHLCSVNEHKGHSTVVTSTAKRSERQKELEASRRNIHQRIQEREKDVKLLQQEVEAINGSADKAVQDSEKTFNEVINVIEEQRFSVKKQIRSQQRAELGRVKELQDKLEEEISSLRMKEAQLKHLSNLEDNTDFLQRMSSITALDESPEQSSNTRPLQPFEDITAALSEVKDKLYGILKISRTKTEVDGLSVPPQPETREDFLQYLCPISLDPNTVHEHLSLSEGNRKVTLVKKPQLYPWHPDRFLERWQVLSSEGLTGRCYLELERSGVEVFIAVAYRDISRTGTFDACAFGNNAKSWGLASYKNGYHFKHGNVKTSLSGPWSSRVGVYLDHGAGILSFYSIAETMTLLHRVQAVFTQPLYVGFRLPNTKGDAVELYSFE